MRNQKMSTLIGISLFAVFVLLFVLLLALPSGASMEADYTIDGTVLTVYRFPDCDPYNYPWRSESITKMIIEADCDHFPGYAFCRNQALEEIIFPENPVSLDAYAVAGCAGLKRICFRAPVLSIGEGAFSGSDNISLIVLTNQAEQEFKTYASLSPYNLEVNGGIRTALDRASFFTLDAPVNTTDFWKELTNLNEEGIKTAAADIDKDGALSISDVSVLLNSLSGPDLSWIGRFFDVDLNETMDIADVSALLNRLSDGCLHTAVVKSGKEATCTKSGLSSSCKCGKCGTALNTVATIPKKPHSPVYVGDVAPTCTTDGYTNCSLCSVCGALLDAQTTTYSTGHVFIGTVCKICSHEAVPSEGLRYKLNSDGKSYSVTGFGSYNPAITKTLVIPSEHEGLPVTSIGYGAFQLFNSCRLDYIVICEGIETIGEFAFSNSVFQTIVIPRSVTSIKRNAFRDCIRLTNICYNGTIEDWMRMEHSVFGPTSGSSYYPITLRMAGEPLTEVTIPAEFQTVPAFVFEKCNFIKNVTIESGITEIGTSAFADANIECLRIPKSVTRIQDSALSADLIIYEGSSEDWEQIEFGEYMPIDPNIQFLGE